MSKGNLIIIGASARAAAQSAIRAGYSPWCIDLFADRDLQAIAPVKRCPREQWPHGILELMKDAPPGPVLLTGAMENHIELLREIERSRCLFTGPVSAIAELRSSRAANRALIHVVEKWCHVMNWNDGVVNAPAIHWEDDVAASLPDRWQPYLEHFAGEEVFFLVKPRRSGGGTGIRIWRRSDEVKDNEYVQWRVPGIAYSGLYFAAAGVAKLLGVTEQIVGLPQFGAGTAFTYVGNLYPATIAESVWLQFQCAGQAVAEWSNITGLFGIDAVLPEVGDIRSPLNGGRIHMVDLNPRYPASAELLERCHVDIHLLEESTIGTNEDMWARQRRSEVVGRAIVYAKERCHVTGNLAHDVKEAIADIPQIGDVLEKGHPVCTVFAQGPTRDACYAGLRDMAAKVYTRLQPA